VTIRYRLLVVTGLTKRETSPKYVIY